MKNHFLILGIVLILCSCKEETYDGRIGYGKKDINNIKYFAKKGNSDAQFNLGFMYDNGDLGSRNEKKAISWYEKFVRGLSTINEFR